MPPLLQVRSQNRRKALFASSRLSVSLSVFCLTVYLSPWNNSAPIGLLSVKFYIWVFFFFSKICLENSSFIKVWQNLYIYDISLSSS